MSFIRMNKYFKLEDGAKVSIYCYKNGPRTCMDENGWVTGYNYHKGYGKDKSRSFKVYYKYNAFIIGSSYDYSIEEVDSIPDEVIANNT